jgi:hypothetical protein
MPLSFSIDDADARKPWLVISSFFETHATQSRVQGILRHATRDRPHGREQKLALSGEIAKLFEERNRAGRERNTVPLAHLHAATRDFPEGGIKVEFGPFGCAQFSRAHKG